MTHATITAARLRELSRLELSRWLGTAVADWAIIALTFVTVAQIDHPVAYVLALIPLGSRQQGLGALFHDAAHGLVTRRRGVNDLLGSLLAAWPLGLTLGGYRRYHFAHHKSLGSADDPENHHKGLIRQWRLPARPLRVALGFASDLFGGGLPHLLAAGKLTRPTRALEALGMLGAWAGLGALFYALDLLWVPILWIASIATVFWSGVRLRIWTEHLGTTGTHRIHVPEWLEQLIMPHDIGLHWEHHRYPTVPFYRLRALRDALPDPPLVSLRELAASFRRSAALASGAVGDTVLPAPLEPPARSSSSSSSALRDLAVHVVAPLLVGAAIYLLVRDRSLAIFDHLARLGLALPQPQPATGAVAVIGAWLPSATWTYALTASVALLWPDAGKARTAYLSLALTVALGWELGQSLGQSHGWWPGTFAAADLLATIVAFCAALRYTSTS